MKSAETPGQRSVGTGWGGPAKRWLWIDEPLESLPSLVVLSHTITKSPSGSLATAGLD